MKKWVVTFVTIVSTYFFLAFSTVSAYIDANGVDQVGPPADASDILVDTGSSYYSSSPSWDGGSSFGSAGNARVNSNMLQVGGGDNSANGDTRVTFKDNFLRNIQVYIMGLLGIVSVSVFLYIGYMLFTAQGKEEEFKKAWMALTYAVIGLAVIPLAYIAVKIVTGFTF